MNRAGNHYLIGLNLITVLTPRRLETLLGRFESPEAIWKAPEKELATVPGISSVVSSIVQQRDEKAIDEELARCTKLGVEVVTILDSYYPSLLRQIEAPPSVLYMKGKKKVETTRTICVVGTRRSSRYGRSVAERLAFDLAAAGLIVVSGLALGIDAAAHKGALDSNGHTVAVLGSGLARIYPPSNRKLGEKVGQTGTLMSEYPLNTGPAKWTFPQRNRILSGMSRGVVVVEAPRRSGALITARLALEQGREVFAVPGNVTSTGSDGTNALIKDGAKLVESADDVISEFPDLNAIVGSRGVTGSSDSVSLSGVEKRVYDLVGLEPAHVDDIIARGGLTPSEVAQALFALQLKNLIEEVEGRRYTRKP